jgi:GGDEF domain-containing protein
MDVRGRWFWVGDRADVCARLTAHFGTPAATGGAAEAGAGDLVVVDSLAGAPQCRGLAGGHVFAAVRGLKHHRRGPRVFVVVDADDRVGVQLARFCLADGVLRWQASDGSLDLGELASAPARGRPSVDDLLARVQAQVAATGQGESSFDRLLRFEREDSLLHRLQDPDTGLFDGPYATLKLDEEWKRSMRFHQPLSLLLLDLGPEFLAGSPAERRAVLADAAGVFLNECRDIDVLARFAPSTFLFLLPGTGPDGAEVLARRILAALGERLGPAVTKGLACGLAAVPSSQIPDRKAFLVHAEACLQAARQDAAAGGLATSWQ